MGHRRFLNTIFPASLCYYDPDDLPGVHGYVALTVDGGPCRQEGEDKCMVSEVQEVLLAFGAKATFFLCTDFVPGHESVVMDLVRDGHEIANRCPADRSYADDNEATFEQALLSAERICEGLRIATPGHSRANINGVAGKVKWFRPPLAKMSSTMRKVTNRHGFTHVLSDCYANDPWIPDPSFIAKTMLSQATNGSIAVIHMPERGFREYNLNALREFLRGVREKGLQVVTLGNMHELAYGGRSEQNNA